MIEVVFHGELGVDNHTKDSHGGYPLRSSDIGSGWSKANDERLLKTINSFVFVALSFKIIEFGPSRDVFKFFLSSGYMSRAHHQVCIICIFHHFVVLMYGVEARGNDDI